MIAVGLLIGVAFAQSTPVATPSDFDRALKCRAYAPVMGALLSPAQTKKLVTYWTAKTEELGKAAGQTPQQVEMSTLLIPIKADDADAVLATCMQAWAADPKSKKPF